jgi:hypothetical protein
MVRASNILKIDAEIADSILKTDTTTGSVLWTKG